MSIEKIYDREYVQGVLGIRIPLNESIFGYSEEFRIRVIKEHLLYEGFIDTLRQAAGVATTYVAGKVQQGKEAVQNFTDNVKNLASALNGIMTDQGLLNGYLKLLKERSNELLNPVQRLFAFFEYDFSASPQIKAILDKVKDSVGKAKDLFQKYIIQPLNGLSGWAGALTGSTIYVLLQYIKGQLGDLFDIIPANAKDVLKDFGEERVKKLVDKTKAIVVEKVSNYFTKLFGQAAVASFTGWIQTIAAVVGSVDWVAEALKPITASYTNAVRDGERKAAGQIYLSRNPIQRSGQAPTATGQPQAAPQPQPTPAPIREHMDVDSLLKYLL